MEPQKLTRGLQPSPAASEGTDPASTLVLDFWSPNCETIVWGFSCPACVPFCGDPSSVALHG